MFVRWQLYRSRQSRPGVNDRLRAVLVESARIDGKPRQQHIAFLGSINMLYVESRWLLSRSLRQSVDEARAEFWLAVTRALDKLGERVSRQQRSAIMDMIGMRVAPLDSTERRRLRSRH